MKLLTTDSKFSENASKRLWSKSEYSEEFRPGRAWKVRNQRKSAFFGIAGQTSAA
jgi:hypothetical protein